MCVGTADVRGPVLGWGRHLASRAGREAPHAPGAGAPCDLGGDAPRGRGGRVRHRPPAAGDGVVLVPNSSSYHRESRHRDPRLLVVVGTGLDSGAGPEGPEPHGVPSGGDKAAGREGDETGEDQPEEKQPEQHQLEAAEEVDVQAHVAAALTRIVAAAGPPPAVEALEEKDQCRVSDGAQDGMEQDE